MKYILPLLLLINCRLSAQTIDTTKLRAIGSIVSVLDTSNWTISEVNGKLVIKGDSSKIMLAVWRRLKEVDSERYYYIALFIHSYEIITGLPDYLKDTTKHVWREYFTELKRMGYPLPIRKQ